MNLRYKYNEVFPPCNDNDIGSATQQEILRQVRWSFNVYLGTITIALLISTIGGGLVLGGKTPEGTATAAAGLVSGAVCTQLSRDSQQKLEILLKRLENLSLPS